MKIRNWLGLWKSGLEAAVARSIAGRPGVTGSEGMWLTCPAAYLWRSAFARLGMKVAPQRIVGQAHSWPSFRNCQVG